MPGCPSSRAPRKIRKSSRTFSGATSSGAITGAAFVFESEPTGCRAPKLFAPDATNPKTVAKMNTARSRRLVRRFIVFSKARAQPRIAQRRKLVVGILHVRYQEYHPC